MSTTQLPREGIHPATPQQLAWLRTQLDEWRTEGLVDDTGSSAIWARYRASRRVSVGRLLLTLGGGFVGVGVIWLVAANLDQFPPLGRFVAVTVLWLALLVGGERLAVRGGGQTRVPAGLAGTIRLVAALAFGAVVFQAAQSLQVPAHEPRLVGCWAAGALLQAYVVRSVPPLLVALSAGVGWFVWQVVDSAPSGFAVVLAVLAAATVCAGLAAVHGDRVPRFAAPYRELGVGLGLVGLFAAALPDVSSDVEWSGWLVAAVCAAALAAAAGGLAAHGSHRLEALAAAAVAVAGAGLVLWDTGTDPATLGAAEVLHALAGVAAYVVVAVAVAVLGTLRDSWRLTAMATMAIVAFTTVQSFAVFAQIIEGAWLFVVLGLVFCGTGFVFDRARRELAAVLEGNGR